MINRAPTRNVCGMVALWRTVIKSSHKLVPGDHQHLRPWSWEIAIITNICRPKSFRLQLTLQENDVWRRPAYIYIYMAEKTDTYQHMIIICLNLNRTAYQNLLIKLINYTNANSVKVIVIASNRRCKMYVYKTKYSDHLLKIVFLLLTISKFWCTEQKYTKLSGFYY